MNNNLVKQSSDMGTILYYNEWDESVEKIMMDLEEEAQWRIKIHLESHDHYRYLDMIFQVPIIFLSAIVSGGNFLSLNFKGYEKMLVVVMGGVSLFVTLLSTISRYLEISSMVENHKTAFSGWNKLYSDIKFQLDLNPCKRVNSKDFTKSVMLEVDRLKEISPMLKKNIMNQVFINVLDSHINNTIDLTNKEDNTCCSFLSCLKSDEEKVIKCNNLNMYVPPYLGSTVYQFKKRKIYDNKLSIDTNNSFNNLQMKDKEKVRLGSITSTMTAQMNEQNVNNKNLKPRNTLNVMRGVITDSPSEHSTRSTPNLILTDEEEKNKKVDNIELGKLTKLTNLVSTQIKNEEVLINEIITDK